MGGFERSHVICKRVFQEAQFTRSRRVRTEERRKIITSNFQLLLPTCLSRQVGQMTTLSGKFRSSPLMLWSRL